MRVGAGRSERSALSPTLHRGEIQSLQWRQIDFLNRTLTVGATKTKAGTGRVIPLNERALLTLQGWATNFPKREPDHFVFPGSITGSRGTTASRTPRQWTQACQSEMSRPHGRRPKPMREWRADSDLRHTACTRLLERGASLSVVASIMGWSASTTAKMAKRYGHIGNEVQRAALDTLVEAPKASQPTESAQVQSGGSRQNS